MYVNFYVKITRMMICKIIVSLLFWLDLKCFFLYDVIHLRSKGKVHSSCRVAHDVDIHCERNPHCGIRSFVGATLFEWVTMLGSR